MWGVIGEALNKNLHPIQSYKIDADNFVDYFSSVGKTVAESFNVIGSHDDITSNLPFNEHFKFSKISPSTVEVLLSQLNADVSNLDILNFDSRLLRNSAKVISHSISILFNLSLSTNKVPKDWKFAKITPIYKGKGDKNLECNYRPISVLPHIAKIMEKCVKFQLVTYLQRHNLITPHQSAYLEKHNMVDNWLENVDNQSKTAVAFLDLTKCFDTVNHEILTMKLKKFNFSKNVIKWFTSYLSDRKQCVKSNGCFSQSKGISLGVPQGSILGPILFVLYINDLPSILKYCSCTIYADDVTLYASNSNIIEAQRYLQFDINSVVEWFSQNKLLVNPNKSSCMVIRGRQTVNEVLTIKINDTDLEQVNVFKLLGVYIDNYLSFKDHCDYIVKTLSPKLGLLSRLSHIFPGTILKYIYNTTIQPHIDYALSVWGGCASSYILPTQRLQNRAARIITRKFDWSVSATSLLNELKIMPILKRYNYMISIIIYKCVNSLVPDYLKSTVRYVSSVHDVNTRNSVKDALYVPRYKLVTTSNVSLKYKGATVWNELPLAMKNSTSVDTFKRKYKLYLSNS